MTLLDIIPYYPPEEVIDTVGSKLVPHDTIAYVEEVANGSSGSSPLMWGLSAIIAALAACIFLLFMVRHRATPEYRQS